ncbi:MAG: helix-hairpin-helix domain-containing protein [Bacilli bacterium]
MFKIMLGVLFFTIITLVVFLNLDPNIVQNSIVETTSIQSDFITATLSGEIQKPGTYIVKKDGQLSDMIALAGGVTTNADETAYQLTLIVQSGGQYYIAPKFDPNDVCGTTALVKVGINSANRDNLMTLSNIGTSLANAVIDYRQTNGSFQYLEQIMAVPGIGQSTFTRIKNYINLL